MTDQCFSEALKLLVLVLTPMATIGGAVLGGRFLLQGHDRASAKRLWVDHRLKLLALAHESTRDTTAAAKDAMIALVAYRRIGSDHRGPEKWDVDVKAAWAARHAFARAGSHLPRELREAANELQKAYVRAHDDVGDKLNDGGHPDRAAAHILAYADAVTAWEACARTWADERWREAEAHTQ